MRSDWSKTHLGNYDNKDAEGNPHSPGWDLDAVKYLVEEKKVGAIGHETSDTDAPAAGKGWLAEQYILQQDKIQIEIMKNLDKCPAIGAMLICSWPALEGGSGFPARCVAIFEK